MRNEVHSTST